MFDRLRDQTFSRAFEDGGGKKERDDTSLCETSRRHNPVVATSSPSEFIRVLLTRIPQFRRGFWWATAGRYLSRLREACSSSRTGRFSTPCSVVNLFPDTNNTSRVPAIVPVKVAPARDVSSLYDKSSVVRHGTLRLALLKEVSLLWLRSRVVSLAKSIGETGLNPLSELLGSPSVSSLAPASEAAMAPSTASFSIEL